MKSTPGVGGDALKQLSARLANSGQVLGAWAGALGDGQGLLARRLARAAEEINQAVRSLTLDDEAFEALEKRSTAAEQRLPALKEMPAGMEPHSGDDALGLRGRSEMISLVEIVGFAAGLEKDGVLQVQSPDEDFIVELRGGDVVFTTAVPQAEGNRLASILIARGDLTHEQLKQAGARAREGELIGQTLVREGLISEGQRQSALLHQAEQVFCRMHRAGSGFDFQFQEGMRILAAEDVRLRVSQLLLESARLLDEETRVRDESTCDERARQNAEQAKRFRTELERRIAAREITLPVLPAMTGQLLSLCWSDDVDTDELRSCVARDQSLSSHVLRMANSAASAPATPISSVQLAIARLGLDKLREAAFALTLKQEVFQLPGWEEMIRGLWHRAAVTSGFGAAVGRLCGSGAVRGSMVGLLLDVGRPVVLSALHDIQRQLGVQLTPRVAERLMDEYHAEMGCLLTEEWSLPRWLTNVMLHHEDYESATEHRLETMVGHLATELAIWAEDCDEEQASCLQGLAVCEALGITPDEVDVILEQAGAILELAQIYT